MSIPTQASPGLAYSKVWSANDSYFTFPIGGTYSGGVVTFDSKNHGLVSGDVVDSTNTDTTSVWNQSGITITVIDKDTFTAPFPEDPGVYDYNKFERYGSASAPREQVKISCSKYSKLMFKPEAIQVNELPAGTEVAIQGKVHSDAAWVELATVTAADKDTLIELSVKYNMVRLVRTSGTGQPEAFSQG